MSKLQLKTQNKKKGMRIIRCQRAFTLIELLWSIAIAAILSSVGIAAFFTYSRIQALNAAVSDFTTMLQLAKFRAQSQVKPTGGDCSDALRKSLDGYKVVLTQQQDGTFSGEYKLVAQCGGNDVAITNQTKNLPQRMSFTYPSDTSNPYFFFQVLTGAVSGGSESVQIGYTTGRIMRIRVSKSGVIQTESCDNNCTAQTSSTPTPH